MRGIVKKFSTVVILLFLILYSSLVMAQGEGNGHQSAAEKTDISTSSPDLSEIIPRATKLSADLSLIENKIDGLKKLSDFEKQYADISENLEGPAVQIQRLRGSKDIRFNKLVELREIIEGERKLLEEISRPLSETIQKFGVWRNEWHAEKKRWEEWRNILVKQGDLDQLDATFTKALNTIDKAQEIIIEQLNALLVIQKKESDIEAKFISLSTDLDVLISETRTGARVNVSPPMFSEKYFSQYSSELWYAFQQGVEELTWPRRKFFDQQGIIVLFQIFLSLVVIITVYRNRQLLDDSNRLPFFAKRPLSTGLFIGAMVASMYYEFRWVPDTLKLLNTTVIAISFTRLLDMLNEVSWKRQFAHWMIVVWIFTTLMHVASLPLPLFRISTVLLALASLLFCMQWSYASRRQDDSASFSWLLRLGSLFFAFILVTEILGKHGLAAFLFMSLIHTVASTLVFILSIKMVHGLLEGVFHTIFYQKGVLSYRNTDAILRQVALFINLAICGLVLLPVIMSIWGIYDSLPSAMQGLLAFGFNLGDLRLSVGLVIISAGILYVSFVLSWLIQKLLVDKMLEKRKVETGVRISIARLVHYVLILIGLFIAILALGFELTKLTIILSALGVGIGFGLQGMVNNFVSGLILLFERPVRVGDYIELDGRWAEIKNIGLRATTVQTFDLADVIVPNADLVTNKVINWTLTNRRVRVTIPVGVAYGSDISLVMETLMECAIASTKVVDSPKPQVLFLSFGENSLDFELRVWVQDAEKRLFVKSGLHQEIDRRFRDAKIEIAFPQRDIHFRSLDESIKLPV